MMRTIGTSALALGALLMLNGIASAGDNSPTHSSFGTTMTLGGQGSADQAAAADDTELTHYYRGGYGGYRGGYYGGYRGGYGGYGGGYRGYYGGFGGGYYGGYRGYYAGIARTTEATGMGGIEHTTARIPTVDSSGMAASGTAATVATAVTTAGSAAMRLTQTHRRSL